MALRLYKPGQGRYVRLGTAGAAGLVALTLCSYVYWLLEAHEPEGAAYWVYVEYGVPALLFAGIALLAAKYLNEPRAADFLIATEGEMKKVSWSSRAEVLGSTAIVIVTVLLLADFIFVADFLVTGMCSRGIRLSFCDGDLGVWETLMRILSRGSLRELAVRLYVTVHLVVVGVVIGYLAAWLLNRYFRVVALGGVLSAGVSVALLVWYLVAGIRIPGIGLW